MFEALCVLQTYPGGEVPQTYYRKYKRETLRHIVRQNIAGKKSADDLLAA
jgi:(2Fe-2S) ferredoxin